VEIWTWHVQSFIVLNISLDYLYLCMFATEIQTYHWLLGIKMTDKYYHLTRWCQFLNLLGLSMTFCPQYTLFVFQEVFLVVFQTMFLRLFYIQLCIANIFLVFSIIIRCKRYFQQIFLTKMKGNPKHVRQREIDWLKVQFNYLVSLYVTDATEVTTTAVPVQNTSSALIISSTDMERSMTWT